MLWNHGREPFGVNGGCTPGGWRPHLDIVTPQGKSICHFYDRCFGAAYTRHIGSGPVEISESRWMYTGDVHWA